MNRAGLCAEDLSQQKGEAGRVGFTGLGPVWAELEGRENCRQQAALTWVSATPVASLTLPKSISVWYMLQRRLSSSSLARRLSWVESSDCSSTGSRWVCSQVEVRVGVSAQARI